MIIYAHGADGQRLLLQHMVGIFAKKFLDPAFHSEDHDGARERVSNESLEGLLTGALLDSTANDFPLQDSYTATHTADPGPRERNSR